MLLSYLLFIYSARLMHVFWVSPILVYKASICQFLFPISPMLFSSGFWHMWDTVPRPRLIYTYIYRILRVHVSTPLWVRFPVRHWQLYHLFSPLSFEKKHFILNWKRKKQIFFRYIFWCPRCLMARRWEMMVAGLLLVVWSSIPGIGVASRSRHSWQPRAACLWYISSPLFACIPSINISLNILFCLLFLFLFWISSSTTPVL